MAAVSLFYGTAAAAMLGLWATLSVVSNEDWHVRVSRVAVATRPSWIPAGPLMAVLRRRGLYLGLCHAAPLALVCGAAWPESALARAAAALIFTAYVLFETSHSHSHRDHANMYVTWALALLPDRLSHGFALGVCIHFIASSGISKLMIGGMSGWAAPSTMRAVLRDYGRYSLAGCGPGWPSLNRWSVRHDVVLLGMSASTLLFECIAVPAGLLMSGPSRLWLVWISVALHLGIAGAQSLLIGLAFVPNVASYLHGFGAPNCEPFTTAGGDWLVAVAVTAASAVCVAARGRVLPEDWPCSPFALFPWSGTQWHLLFERFSRGRTRLVLATADCMEGKPPVGCPVLPKDACPDPVGGVFKTVDDKAAEADVVHDGWEQVIGETLVMSELLPSFDFDAMAQPGWAESEWPGRLVTAVERWLVQYQRLVVIATGKPLLRAYFVRMADSDDRVIDIIAGSNMRP